MNKLFIKGILFSLLCALSINTSFASIYKCTSSTGAVSYSGTPCPYGSASSITLSTSKSTSSTSTSTYTAPTTTTTSSSTSTFGSLFLATPTTSTTTNVTAVVTDSIFAPSSFWYKPIPADVVLHTNSVNFVKEFIRQKVTYYNNVNINTDAYSSPVCIASSSTPTVKVSFNDCQKKGWEDPTFTNMMSAVPIPATAKQASGTDGEMTIYQPSTNTIWEL